ncbi:bifunctional metallophosphatase/5'-nucleotidase [Lacticaseibacillus nasuensis]|uniref:bifunctional metallophosphatase/5'-nucleotidase n=1 Tax=Lacticaseibacillus nasuensis TaxID=944671 RepID=UPI0022456DEF|nr:bifunctional UDP-sugar hydrolase/5'-nucleotidase [Lacticaseibacillus nasuensis]MCX2454818.1 bifunctional metallophosphatase/5'-nucleotidase [Lacticaseibacillus nasuensis]
MKLTILSTSDTHGYVLPTDYMRRDQDLPFSLAKAKTVIDQVKATADEVLTVENGDWLQGSPLAYYAARVHPDPAQLTAGYAAVGYDLGILGNHEFNYGSEYLQQAISGLNYPILCANILRAGQPAFGRPYELVKRGGVTIAVLGLTTDYIPHWEGQQNIAGLTFVPALAAAKDWVPRLRALADVVVVCYHGGFERDLITGEPTEALTGENVGYALTQVPGIDALVTGHQHRELAGIVNGVPVTQPGYRGANVGRIDLTLTPTLAGWQVTAKHATLVATGTASAADAVTAAVADPAAKVEDWLDSPLGRVTGDMTIHDAFAARVVESPYIEFINRVQMAATGTDISGTALFNNDGRGFGQVITMRDVVTNYIYPNTLAVVRLSGADLKAALEQSAEYFALTADGHLGISPRFLDPKPQHYNYDMYEGIDYQIDVAQPVGQRITALTYHGQPVTAAQSYDVAVNQYRAGGGGDFRMFDHSKIIRENQKDMTELIADYLRAHPVLPGTANHNFTVLPKM